MVIFPFLGFLDLLCLGAVLLERFKKTRFCIFAVLDSVEDRGFFACSVCVLARPSVQRLFSFRTVWTNLHFWLVLVVLLGIVGRQLSDLTRTFNILSTVSRVEVRLLHSFYVFARFRASFWPIWGFNALFGGRPQSVKLQGSC